MVQLTDNTGATQRSYDYDAFGNELAPNENDDNPLRYNGQYWDEETGTYYLRARQYNPVAGRFTTEDTHWTVGNMIYDENGSVSLEAILQAGNLYAYCMGNPVMFVDPAGEDAYIFYTSKDELSVNTAIYSYSELKEEYDTVHYINVNTPEDFYRGWASMGWKNDGTKVPIEYVGVFLHGADGYYMSAGDGQPIYADKTVSKNIDNLVFITCSAGAEVTVGTNIVDQIMSTNKITTLVAADKNVGVVNFRKSKRTFAFYVSDKGSFYRYTKDEEKIIKSKLRRVYFNLNSMI